MIDTHNYYTNTIIFTEDMGQVIDAAREMISDQGAQTIK